jgi:hypothetical protein
MQVSRAKGSNGALPQDRTGSEMHPLDNDAWTSWSPVELAARLSATPHVWYIVGGWALDLWHGQQTRSHGDLEFAVLLEGADDLRKFFPELEFFLAREGTLNHLSHAAKTPTDATQLWGADMSTGCWRVDMMVERGTAEVWQYKRDPAFTLPRAAAVHKTTNGIPFLAPALVLLFKAKHRREKDEVDFQTALPKLTAQEKADLRGWLGRLHPGHVWIDRL